MGSGDSRGDERGDTGTRRGDACGLDAAARERRVALDAIAGAVSHELAHTLNFLRVLVEEASAGSALASDDLALARREVQRLARLMGNLRQLTLPCLALQAVPLRDAAQQVADGAHLAVAASIDRSVTVAADPALLSILLRDVVADVARRATKPAPVDVRVVRPRDAASARAGSIEVLAVGRRDDRNDGDLATGDRFAPWGTGRMGGDDVGLAVAARVARLFGWTLEEMSDGGREGVRVAIPAAAFDAESRRCES